MGQGPAPRQNRQRKQTPQLGDWVRLAPMAEPVIPELDEFESPDPDLPWPLRTRILWASWREDPVTQTWNAGDLAFAVDAIYLHGTSADAKASEIRIRMESLGLTPKGRRDGRWLLPDEEEPVRSPSADPAAPVRELPEAV